MAELIAAEARAGTSTRRSALPRPCDVKGADPTLAALNDAHCGRNTASENLYCFASGL